MEINDFIEKFAEQFEDTDAGDITATTVFKNLDEWSSLIALSVIAMADEEYDVTLKGDDIRGAVTVEVANTGKKDGTEVVQLYIRNLQDPDGPLKSLRAFERVNVKAGQAQTVALKLNRSSFEFWDAETNTMRVKPGKYEILVGTSSSAKDLRKLDVSIN